jgi:glucose/arabinose dehydrogenase
MRAGVMFLAVAITAAGSAAFAQSISPPPGTTLKYDAATLPKPGATRSGVFSPKYTIPSGMPLTVPQGFVITLFAQQLPNPRKLLVAPNGDVLLASQGSGKILVLRDADGDGKAETITDFAQGLSIPYGMALGKDALYVGAQDGISRIPYKPGDTKASGPRTVITPSGAFGNPGGHSTRNVALSPDGKKIYAAIGSASNFSEEASPRATIQAFDLSADGMQATNQRTFTSGTRNPVGLAVRAGTSDLYITVNERDTLGDELVPDYFTKISDGAFFGWPYSYIGKNPQPGLEGKRADLVAKAQVPEVLFRSHSAPLGFAFYDAKQFPAAYQGGAFVALHGSWNSPEPHGYFVAFVPFAGGKPSGDYRVFAGGWLSNDGKQISGRPADVAVAKDGSLLIADDASGIVWRVSYKGN